MKAKIRTCQIDLFLRNELMFILNPSTDKGHVYTKAIKKLKIVIPKEEALPEDVVVHILGKTRFKRLQQYIVQLPK
ncbi:hypothetical protein ACFOW1_15800 [Parasediminibacterium paludis]|uniref:Uncharacterized protein n=1 Tax=Parasediminibacterium paludis TaxID=908966 RepID=A0ABV8Q2I4_9BACT